MIALYNQGYPHLFEIWLLVVILLAAFLWRAERRPPPAATWILPYVLGLGLALTLLLFSDPPPFQLFEDLRVAYIGAARHVLRDPVALYREYTHGFVNIPIIALPFVPLTWLSEVAAVLVFTGLGVVVSILAAFGLHRLAHPAASRVLWIPSLFLVCGPLFNSLREGNTTHGILAALVLAFAWLARGRDLAAGIVLGFCAVVKLPLLLLGAPLLLRGRLRAAAGMGVGVAAVAGLSVLIFGMEAHIVWWNEILRPSAGRPVGAFNVQSMDGLWVRLLTGTRHLRDWQPIVEPGALFLALRWTGIAMLLGVSGAVLWKAGAPQTQSELRHELVIALLLSLLLSPITWSHYALWMLIPLALLAGGDLPWPKPMSARMLLITGALCILAPVQLVPPMIPILRQPWARLGASHVAIGTLLLWAVLLRERTKRDSDKTLK